jgi:hypothetical protein
VTFFFVKRPFEAADQSRPSVATPYGPISDTVAALTTISFVSWRIAARSVGTIRRGR